MCTKKIIKNCVIWKGKFITVFIKINNKSLKIEMDVILYCLRVSHAESETTYLKGEIYTGHFRLLLRRISYCFFNLLIKTYVVKGF